MSGIQTGSPPAQAGTATVPDETISPPATTATEAVVTPAQPVEESATAKALLAVTEQLAAMQAQIAAVSARAEARDAESRTLRNEHTARQTVTAAVEAVPAAWRAQIQPRVTAAVLAAMPTTESGEVDTVALDTAVKTAVEAEVGYYRAAQAQALEEAGIGLPSGLGTTSEPQVDDGLDTELKALFEHSLGLNARAATIAVKGRD